MTDSMNLRHWAALEKTDPKHTKQFSRPGGFKGTAIKPIWTERRITEHFGPCGIGWGIDLPAFQVVTTGEETLVYCTVVCWYLDSGKRADLYGVGGDKVSAKRADGRVVTDDEAFKKAFTDAIGNAFKHIGCGADVHMGLFDDSKYVATVKKEFAGKAEVPQPRTKGHALPPHPEEPPQVGADRQHIRNLINAINHHIKTAPSDHVLDTAMDDAREDLEKIEQSGPAGIEAAKTLRARYNARIAELRDGKAA